MGKGGSTEIIYQAPQATAAAETQTAAAQSETVTPAIAKSISHNTEVAQQQQLAARQRMRGVSSTYLRGAAAQGGKSKLGQ